jgi:transcriptional regulator with XRE-family HTH domain
MSGTSCYLLDVSTGRPPSKEATDFGKRVAEARRQRGLTQRQLADLLGVSQKMVDYFERRAENVTADILKRLATALDVSADDLLGLRAKRPKPGPKSRLQTQIEQIQRLSKAKQATISEILDMAVKSSAV